MPANGQTAKTPKNAPQTYEELVRQVAQRVWELWRQDLRRERERRGQRSKR